MEPSSWHSLTHRCHRLTATFQVELAAVRKVEENHIARLVLPKFTTGLVRTNRLRVEKAIKELEPTIDPMKNFWNIFGKATQTETNDDDPFEKYDRDLDTSLLFVSISTPFVYRIPSIPLFSCVRRVSSPQLPRLSSYNSLH